MAIGERIRFIRNLRGMTQKYLGLAIGFDDKSADVRVAQYESGVRTPKENMTDALAHALEVSTNALTVPDIDNFIGLMHTLFACEDLYGLKINKIDNELCLTLNKHNNYEYTSMFEMFSAWQEQAEKLKNGEITREQYDKWRYNYPKFDTTGQWGKVPSKEFSDFIVDTFINKK